MKVLNNRGRVLLEVYVAHDIPAEKSQDGKAKVLYSYRGPGCGGWTDQASLMRMIGYMKLDSPSARCVGELPKPIPLPEVTP